MAFARAGACVVSGLATGIDGAAHRAALEAGGATIAVLGTGLDMNYPKGHRLLQRTIGEKGLLISELEPEDHGMKFTFLERNRIIAALARVTIVVEAPEQSGALNTAEHALDLHRDLGAVPGPIDQPQSVGSNRLMRDGAQPITSIEDALALAGLTPPPRTPKVDPLGDEGRVWSALAAGALDLDSLCNRSGLRGSQCLAAVTQLEIAGSIEWALTGEIRRR
jgi:DNA processing protein